MHYRIHNFLKTNTASNHADLTRHELHLLKKKRHSL